MAFDLTNLISHWKLDEASGNALDAHGSNDLTDNNTVGTAAGKIETGRDFERTNSEYFSIASNAELSTGNADFEISAWVKLESKPASQMMIVAKDVDTGREFTLMYDDGSDRFYFVIFGSGGFPGVYALNFGSPSVDTWYHVRAWFDATTDVIGISVNDGTPDLTSTTTNFPSGSGAAFCIGARTYPGFANYFDGVIDEVSFWKRLLTTEERTAIYNGGDGVAYPFSGDDWTPILPQVEVDTTLPADSDGPADASPANSMELQDALDDADQDDGHTWIIELDPDVTYAGTFVVRAKAGSQELQIRTRDWSLNSTVGTRVRRSDASRMATIQSIGNTAAIKFEFEAQRVRIRGVEVTTDYASTVSALANLIEIGRDPTTGDPAASLSNLPQYITLEQDYIHGTPGGNVTRGVLAEARHFAAIDSYFEDFHNTGADAQAICSFQCQGAKVENNRLEGAGENVMFGGGDPSITDAVPTDITVSRNHFYKPRSWKSDDPSYAGIPWVNKNHLELKNALRILIEGNVFENSWPGQGHPIVFTPRNQDNTAPWSIVDDVTFRLNIVRYTPSFINLVATDDGQGVPGRESEVTNRMLIENNLVITDGLDWNMGSDRTMAQMLSVAGKPMAYLQFKHNTFIELSVLGNAAALNESDTCASHARFLDNIWANGIYGFKGSGHNGGTESIDAVFPDYEWNNVIVYQPPDSNPSLYTYPSVTHEVDDNDDVGFTDFAGGDYSLAPTSPYSGTASDDTDYGVDWDALMTATDGVVVSGGGATTQQNRIGIGISIGF